MSVLSSEECCPMIYRFGTPVLLTHSVDPKDLDAWVTIISKDSGEQVDWHFAGGRAVILGAGVLERIRASILRNIDSLMDAQRRQYERYGNQWYPYYRLVEPQDLADL